MERVIVNQGTKTPLYQLFEDLQNYTNTNSRRTIGTLIDSFGIAVGTTASGVIDPTDTAMQVTAILGNDYVSVGAGEAITAGFNYLSVGPGQTVSTVGLADNSWHTLYLRHAYSYSDPVDIMSGFVYGISGIAQRSSRAHDGIEFIWDVSPGASGVVLANVAVATAGQITNGYDRRIENVLKLHRHLLPDEVVRTDRTFVQELDGGLKVTALTLYDDTNPVIIMASGVGVHSSLTMAQFKTLVDRSHIQGTDTGTTATTFRVGNTTTTSNDGYLVATIEDIPMPPKNIRIVDVTPSTQSPIIAQEFKDQLTQDVRTGLITHQASVYFKWNYDDIQGYGGNPGTGQFRMLGGTRRTNKVFETNELVGYFLWIPSVGLNYKITANTASEDRESNYNCTLTVTPWRHATSIDGINVTGTSKAWIHSGATEYEYVIEPTDYLNDREGGGRGMSERYEGIIRVPLSPDNTDSPTAMSLREDIFLGETVSVKIRAVNGTQKSSFGDMGDGSYTKLPPFIPVQTYTMPWVVQLPGLDSTGVSVSAAPTAAGFAVNVVGWDLATDYEICYTTDVAGPDFANPSHQKILTSQHVVEISTPDSYVYYVAVRPIMGGQAVAAPKTTVVTSGGGKTRPGDLSWGPISAKLKSYDGTITVDSANRYTVSTCITGPDNTATRLSDHEIGQYILVGSTEYVIDEILKGSTEDKIMIVNANGTPALGLSGAFSVGQTKPSRWLASTTFSIDAQITRIEIEVLSKGGYPSGTPVVRWYQESKESLADSMVISGNDPTYQSPTDVIIASIYGTRTLVIDAWDPSTNDNVSGLYGNITVYYKPYYGTASTLPYTMQITEYTGN